MLDEFESSARLLPQAEEKVEPPISGEQICLPFVTEAVDGLVAEERPSADDKVEPVSAENKVELVSAENKIEPDAAEDKIEGSFAIGIDDPTAEEFPPTGDKVEPPSAEAKIESSFVMEAVAIPAVQHPTEVEEVKPVPAENKVELVSAEDKVENSLATETVNSLAVEESPSVADKVKAAVAENRVEPPKVEPAAVEAKVEPARVPEKVRKASAGEKAERPFRVKLRGSVLALVRLPNKRSVRAAIHQLSTSGGVIHLEKPLDEKLEVEFIFHISKKTIHSKVQMLFPMWATQGWMQPFRFVNLPDASREILDASLKLFLGEAAKGATAGG